MAELITVARPYAKAVFHQASSIEERQRWSNRLQLLSVIVSAEEMKRAIASPKVSAEQIIDLISELFGKELGPEGVNLVGLLVNNRRMVLVPMIADLYEAMRSDAEGVADVVVTSASDLTEAQKRDLTATLTRRLGRQVRMHCEVNKDLLGGAVIRAGDLVIDGSVEDRLTRLSQALIH